MLNGPLSRSIVNSLLVSATACSCIIACAVSFPNTAAAQSQNRQPANQGNSQQQYRQPANQAGQQYQGQANQGQANQGQTNQGQGYQRQGYQTQANQQYQQSAQQQPKLTPQQLAAQQKAAAQRGQVSAQELQRKANEYAAWEAQQAAQKMPPKALNMPKGFPLVKEEAEYVGKLLDFWETNSKKVTQYKCQFMRFNYDADVGYRDPATNRLAAQTVAFGEIRFASPDRARYETTKISMFAKPPAKPGAEAAYKESKSEEDLERWITDGKRIYEFDFANKILYDDEIPKHLQGNVAESPLPFLFGVSKTELLSRYWVRSIPTPNNITNEYWLEMFPKRIEDARNYKKIEITIAREDFLPKAMHLYLPQYDPAKGNEDSQYFRFENRQVNGAGARIADFFKAFVNPRLPRGWKRVNRATQNSSQAALPQNTQQQQTRQPQQQQGATRR